MFYHPLCAGFAVEGRRVDVAACSRFRNVIASPPSFPLFENTIVQIYESRCSCLNTGVLLPHSLVIQVYPEAALVRQLLRRPLVASSWCLYQLFLLSFGLWQFVLLLSLLHAVFIPVFGACSPFHPPKQAFEPRLPVCVSSLPVLLLLFGHQLPLLVTHLALCQLILASQYLLHARCRLGLMLRERVDQHSLPYC